MVVEVDLPGSEPPGTVDSTTLTSTSTVDPGQDDSVVDTTTVLGTSVGDLVWEDLDEDGVKDGMEISSASFLKPKVRRQI